MEAFWSQVLLLSLKIHEGVLEVVSDIFQLSVLMHKMLKS